MKKSTLVHALLGFALLSSTLAQTTIELAEEKLADLGIRRFEFRARPTADQVVILRVEENHPEQGVEVYDSITYQPGREAVDHVLLQDLGKLYGDMKGKWGIIGSYGGGVRDIQMQEVVLRKNILECRFRSLEAGKKVDILLQFHWFIASYEDTKKLCPKLPDRDANGWTFGAMIKKQGHPPNPHNMKEGLIVIK